jgi:hypothetical protein
MGQMRFHAPPPEQLLPHAVEQAYLAGVEGIPWHCCNTWSNGILSLHRAVSESGTLSIPWDVPGHGPRVLSTCTLMERDRPYGLVIELARGTLHRARSLVAERESAGISVAREVPARLQAASAALIGSITDTSASDDEARRAIQLAVDAIVAVCQDRGAAEAEGRRRADPTPDTLLATQVNVAPPAEPVRDALRTTFHAVNVPLRWRELQPSPDTVDLTAITRQIRDWRECGMRIFGGPLIQLDPFWLPEWAHPRQNQYGSFEHAAIRFTQSVVRQLDPLVDMWICAGRLNLAGWPGFSEEQRLRLAVTMIESVRQASPRTPVVISFDQPWAEYLAREDQDLSPLHFADALVRAELGVAGVGVELNLGYWPHGSLPRDLGAISSQLDRWSLLGIPLILFLTLPSDAAEDPLVEGDTRVVSGSARNGTSAAMDQSQAEHLVPLLIAKPHVQAVVWNQLSDAQPHQFPQGGLLDACGVPKPILALLRDVRRRLPA